MMKKNRTLFLRHFKKFSLTCTLAPEELNKEEIQEGDLMNLLIRIRQNNDEQISANKDKEYLLVEPTEFLSPVDETNTQDEYQTVPLNQTELANHGEQKVLLSLKAKKMMENNSANSYGYMPDKLIQLRMN